MKRKNAKPPPVQTSDLMILLNSGNDDLYSAELQSMLSKFKRAYVEENHKQKIYQVHSKNSYRNGRWKTYVYENGKRRSIELKTEEDIYCFLYSFYKEKENAGTKLEDVFQKLCDYKERELGNKAKTVANSKYAFSFVSKDLKSQTVKTVSENDLRRWLVTEYLPTVHPKKERLKKMIQCLKQTFKYAQKLGLRSDNPASSLEAKEYYKYCSLSEKRPEDKQFSREEVDALRNYALSKASNPRAIMMLVEMETGLRAAELSAVKQSDILEEGFLHIHRQQLSEKHDGEPRTIYFADYNKNERNNPKGGRYVPITKACQTAIDMAKASPGTSEWLFHDADGSFVKNESYQRYLRRACKKLGITTTNNHAFRMAFNFRLHQANIAGNDRSLILGHSVETNERFYSYTDSRRLTEIKEILLEKEEEADKSTS